MCRFFFGKSVGLAVLVCAFVPSVFNSKSEKPFKL